MGTWFNKDNLLVKFGVTKTLPDLAGEYKTFGALREIEVKIDLTTLTTTPGATILSDQVFLPKGARVEEVVVETLTAATSSGSGTVDFGLIGTDRATEVDFNGFIAAMAKGTVDTVGKKQTLTVGVTGYGALVGVPTTAVGYLCANVNTAVYQTGVIIVRVRYAIP